MTLYFFGIIFENFQIFMGFLCFRWCKNLNKKTWNNVRYILNPPPNLNYTVPCVIKICERIQDKHRNKNKSGIYKWFWCVTSVKCPGDVVIHICLSVLSRHDRFLMWLCHLLVIVLDRNPGGCGAWRSCVLRPDIIRPLLDDRTILVLFRLLCSLTSWDECRAGSYGAARSLCW